LAAGGAQTINFNFKYYYFNLHDFKAVFSNITTGVTLAVGACAITTIPDFNYSYYCDTVEASVLVTATDTASSVMLYSSTFQPATFNVL